MKNSSPIPCTLALLVLAVLAVVVVLSLDPHSAAAQYPKPIRRPVSTPDIAKHLTSARFNRVVIVDSSGGGDFKEISEALVYVAAKKSSERNWTSRWTVMVYPGQRGSADPDAFGSNYSEASLTIPAYTEVMGFSTGENNPLGWMGGAPVIELRATSGTLVRLGGGSSMSNLHFVWVQTPTAAVKGLDHTIVPDQDPKNHNVSSLGQLTNVSFQLVARNNSSFVVDGITESTGGLLVYGGGVMINGSTSGRAVVNAGSLGVSLHGGRYGGASGCTGVMADTAAGPLKLFAGLRIDSGCVNELLRTGTGPIEVQGGIGYTRASGTITHGNVQLPFGTANPPACSPGAAFLNTTSGIEKLCLCTATDTWRCAPLS
jgi:hypothetical protein